MYRWIKKIRHDNQDELNRLEYDEKHECIKYWGSRYESLKFRIDNEGELHIHPIGDVTSDEMHFRLLRMKIENALYDLDTEKATWIIARRKHLMI